MKTLEEMCRQYKLESSSLVGCKFQDVSRLTMLARLAYSTLTPLREITDDLVKECNDHQRRCILTCPISLPFKEGTNRWDTRIIERVIVFFVLGHDANEVLNAATPLLNAVLAAHTEETEYTFLR